jgi:hypothetical protein
MAKRLPPRNFFGAPRVGAETAAAAAARGVVVVVNRLTDPFLASLLLRQITEETSDASPSCETFGISRCQLSFDSVVPKKFLPFQIFLIQSK